MAPTLSVIIPTRERATYLRHAIRTCTVNPEAELEILVLDNASGDDTAQVVASIDDRRIRYERSDVRLSMRDNFERAMELARGEYVCCIGDDDGLMPNAVRTALELFAKHDVDAVSAARAHYFWPDLLSPRRNTGLLPRGAGTTLLNTRTQLAGILQDCDYYRLPCIYHGFVRKAVIDRITKRQGRFFLSSQVDMYSAIAISCENLQYAYSRAPLVINGGSSRSTGASHFVGGAVTEKQLWKKEDDIGFLPGFENSISLGAYVIESALRHVAQHPDLSIRSIFEPESIRATLEAEARARQLDGRSTQDCAPMYLAVGMAPPSAPAYDRHRGAAFSRLRRLARSYVKNLPVDFATIGVVDVEGAARHFGDLLTSHRTGLLDDPLAQIKTSLRILKA